MFRAIKSYCPHAGGHTSDIVLGTIGLFFLVLGILCQWIIGISDLGGLFFTLCIAAWYYPFGMLIFVKLPDGYLLEKDKLVFYCKFKRNELLYEDIKCIIITNLIVSLRTTKTPWVAMIGEQENELLSYLNNDKKKHVLTSTDIKCMLGEKIGFWHPGNSEKFFQKGSRTIHNYGFCWNKREMYKVLEGFKGDYYIAASVFSNYKEECDALCEKYSIDRQRIHIVDDSCEGEFIWYW